jgi:hypothetical protein
MNLMNHHRPRSLFRSEFRSLPSCLVDLSLRRRLPARRQFPSLLLQTDDRLLRRLETDADDLPINWLRVERLVDRITASYFSLAIIYPNLGYLQPWFVQQFVVPVMKRLFLLTRYSLLSRPRSRCYIFVNFSNFITTSDTILCFLT